MIVTAYPFGVLLVGTVLNLLAFGVAPLVVALPSEGAILALVIAGGILVANHTWLMTRTELVRVRSGIFATPEERAAAGATHNVSKAGLEALERCHNAHRNTTENTVYFGFLAITLVLVSPTPAAAQVWIIGFAVARLGYTYAYLAGRDNVRGLFMTLGLLSLYGMVSYLGIGFFVGS